MGKGAKPEDSGAVLRIWPLYMCLHPYPSFMSILRDCKNIHILMETEFGVPAKDKKHAADAQLEWCNSITY